MSRDVIGIEACQHLLANKDAEIERLRADCETFREELRGETLLAEGLAADKAELLAALRGVDEEVDGYEDIDNNGGPNLAMRVQTIVRAAVAKVSK